MTKKKNTDKTTRCKETIDLEEWLEAHRVNLPAQQEAAAPHNEDQGEGEAGG